MSIENHARDLKENCFSRMEVMLDRKMRMNECFHEVISPVMARMIQEQFVSQNKVFFSSAKFIEGFV